MSQTREILEVGLKTVIFNSMNLFLLPLFVHLSFMFCCALFTVNGRAFAKHKTKGFCPTGTEEPNHLKKAFFFLFRHMVSQFYRHLNSKIAYSFLKEQFFSN